MSLDRISLLGLRVFARHGVLEHERAEGQEFVIDAVVWLDTAPAAATDDVTRTVHYGELAGELVRCAAGPPVNLIETLADRLVAICLSRPCVQAAEVTVHKPQAPIPHPFRDVTVTIHRTRE